MTRLILVLTFLGLALAPQRNGPPALPMIGCPESDPCSDPSKPWLRGGIEKWCGRDDAAIAKIQKEFGAVVVNKCACQHMCDSKAEHADETAGRVWDTRCAVRCSPKHCTCPSRCDS